MADELWIVRDDQSCGWCVDAKGKVTTDDEYFTEGKQRVNIGVADAPLTQKQADAIRGLICDLRKDGVLDGRTAVGVQYPQRILDENVQQSENYLRSWADDCDEEWHTTADLGVCTEIPWVDGVVIEPPEQPEDTASAEKVRARNEKGHFIADNPDTEEDEAWVEADSVPQPIEEKPAAGEEESLQGERESVEPGMQGEAVESWQSVCNEIVLSHPLLTDDLLLSVDGGFGEATENTTRAVQEVLGVPATGAVDSSTWAAAEGV